ncbi:YjfB family protein [Bordetella bronchialis]|nr:YjfB family protein [Bordetella bronchialis]
MSIEGTVGAAVALQQANALQEAQNSLLRKALDNQAQTIASLIGSVSPQLSTYGMVGTQLHVTA